MNVYFYENASEPKTVDKVTNIKAGPLTGYSREDLNILEPSIVVEYQTQTQSAILNSNYMYIEDLNRYYYIKGSPIILNNKLMRVDGNIDVLMSHKDFLREQTAIIKRQENNWNLYLDDGFFRTYQNPIIQEKKFPNGFDLNNFTWVLVTAAG